MKKCLILLVFSFSFMFINCSKDSTTSPPLSNSQSTGKVFFKIDKENAPENVVSITASLTRQGFETIVGSLNLVSDSTADITIADIPIGVWRLKVEARDVNNLVVYSGETEVTIMENMVVQVNLTLVPTSTGTGSIYILVNWGVPATTWVDFAGNPVLSKFNNNYDSKGISHPVILYENEQYKMWYNGMSEDGGSFTFYAVSVDGINWERQSNAPVFMPSNGNGWDNKAVYTRSVIKENDTYKLFYAGYSTTINRWQIGMATSIDGINWTRYQNNPIIASNSNSWEYNLGLGDVVKANNQYYLYYAGRRMNTNEDKIGLATSIDGINWTRYSQNPILSKTYSWEESGVNSASVIVDQNIFKMVYMNTNADGMSFGFATSVDGKNWNKSISNPFFGGPITSNGWAKAYASYPCFRKIENEYRIYYSGASIFDQRYGKIGFVRRLK